MADTNEGYLSLITSEYYNKPLFNSYVSSFLNEISPIVNCLDSFDQLFTIENAVGDQLDKIGEIIGISRVLPVDDPDIPSSLSDSSYRLVLKAKILKNHWNGTRQGMSSVFSVLFPNCPFDIVDNQDMTINIWLINPNITDEQIALIFNGFIFPKPAGVRMYYNIMLSGLFGWDRNTDFIKGWDTGLWGNT